MAFVFIRKNWSKILLTAVLLLILPFCLIYFVLSIPQARRVILDYTESTVNRQIVGEVRIKDFATDIFTHLTIYGVTARNIHSPHEDTLNIKRIEIKWRIPALLKRRVEVRNITITTLYGSALRDREGKLHFPLMPIEPQKPEEKEPEPKTPPPAPEKKSERRPWKFVLNSILLKNSHLSFSDSKFHAKLELHTDISLALKQDTINIKIMAESGKLLTPVLDWYIDTVFVDARIEDNKHLRIEHLVIHSDSTNIDVKGVIPFLEDEFWDLITFVSIPLKYAALPAINGSTIEPEGMLEVFLQMNGAQLKPFGELKLNCGKVNIGNVKIDTLHSRTVFSIPESLKTDWFLLTDAGSGQGNISIELNGNLPDTLSIKSYQLDAVLKELSILKFLNKNALNSPDQTLKANAIITVTGSGEDLQNKFPREAEISVLFDLPKPYAIEPARLNISVKNKVWTASGLLGMLNKLDGGGTICKDSISGQFNAVILNPQLISAPFINPPISGKLSLNTFLDGPLSSPNIRAAVTSSGLNWNGINADTLHAKAVLRENKIFITESMLLLSTDLDTQKVFSSPVRGKVEAAVKANGSIDNITAHADFKAEHIDYNIIHFDIIEGNAVYYSDTVKWEDVKFKNVDFAILNAGKLSVRSGLLSFYSNMLFEHKGEAAGYLETVGKIGNDSVSAVLQGRQISTSAVLQFTRLPVFTNLNGLINRNHGTIELDLAADGSKSSPKASLNILLNQHINEEVSTSLKSSFHLLNDTINGNGKLELSASDFTDTNGIFFTVNIPLRYETSVKKISSGAQAQINSTGFPVGQIISSASHKINANATAFIDMQTKYEQNTWTLSGNTFVQIDTFFHTEKKLSGADLPVKVSISGTAKNPFVSIDAKRGSMEYQDIGAKIINIEAAISNQQIIINTLEFAFDQDGYALISARYPLNKKVKPLLGVRATYELKKIPLPMLSSVLNQTEIKSGTLTGKGKIAFGDTVVSYGLLRIDSLIINQQKINRPIGPVYATITHNNKQISLPYLRGRLGGPFSIQGRITCADKTIETISIFAEGRNIRFRYGNNVDLGIGKIELLTSGHGNKIDSITGVIDLGETRYYRNLAILDLLEQLLTIKTERAREVPPLLEDTRLRFDLRLKSNAIVITSAGRMHLTGRLIFAGTVAQPTIDGEVRLVQAHIRYLDRRFNIGDEYIRRMRPVAIDRLISPVNDEAIRSFIFDEQKDFIIGIALKGSLFEPKAMFTSHPPLKTEHIINLLTAGSIALNPSSLYSPAEIASVYAGGWIAWELMELTDITFIDINGDFSDFTEERGPRLTLFQRFTEKVYGSYQLQLGRPEDQALSVIYRFMPRFFVSGTAGTKNSGAGLWFFFRR
ncbi:MAG: translocation/assembly module TamB [Chitinispirillales bacterium]|jgi:hypothetical protein|nr:translocation/assembly module TamB [Chitinispirillales bacterium]